MNMNLGMGEGQSEENGTEDFPAVLQSHKS